MTASCVNPIWIPERVQLVSEQSEPAERCQQPDAGDRRREHERDLGQRDDQRPARKPPAREQVRGRRSDHEYRHVRDRARLEADDESVASDLAPQRCEQVPEGNAEEDRDEREEQERERDRRREGDEDAEEAAAHYFFGSPKPARFSSKRPRFEVTFRMKARAPTLRGVELTIAIS